MYKFYLSIFFQAVFSVRAAVYHGRLFSTSYVAAQKVISCLYDCVKYIVHVISELYMEKLAISCEMRYY